MIDIVHEIEATRREVGSGRIAAGDGTVVRLTRTFDAPIDDVWDAITDPGRIGRWFLPVSGDFRIGGRYQLEGNAGGQIVSCDRPNQLKVTWVYMDTGNPADVSEVVVRLTKAGDDATTLVLEHTAIPPEGMWPVYGPGAVGVGWDGAILGLALHLQGLPRPEDPAAWQLSPEGREFTRLSSESWGTANVAFGADPEVARQAVLNTIEFYAPSVVSEA